MDNKPFETGSPLFHQKEIGDIEKEVKSIFLEVFKETLGDKVDGLLQYGMPYVSQDIDVLYPFFSMSGLNTLKNLQEVKPLAYLMKAWTIRNPKRGFHFLNTYLQMLYPNSFRIAQMYQETAKNYPIALSNKEEMEIKGTPHWLTSRVKISVTDWEETGDLFYRYAPILQTLISARFVLMLEVLREFSGAVGLGLATAGTVYYSVDFTGTIK
ncbi:hypothetical protein [Gallibacterium anatis]|uniref:hypothetical protein n=1 Tax=Gallibacterium anatis TaxID=750 RepID=UPI000531F3A9|nr:hypothetical protein [Gallibacterium anatis]KGQ44462.1 hypothetical protein JP29_08900 [Gallibacterium anatis]